ncbi:hypothetical protein M427DRAFT_133787 [Gonapodya prolifera JEL478]|uniref:HMG box domain-containing protein n=1 Tax=Gonapodya prolifera (strain JEL478) TaxID=1344416 RepID=A0A139AJQ6_GONPJ|nr:hypothetical protein M427DRAFT_133787 [Gonapodya prolifera JEL478]|eukprot:KXS17017.1 hypothetical protein M427DRAFT_133787 [Gonapodya prolifera JEL478]
MPSGGLTSPFQPASPFQPGAMLVTSTPATDNVLAQPHQLEAQTLNILNHMPDVNRGLNIANLIHVDQSGGASGASPLPGGQQPLLLHHLQTPHPSLQTLVIAATSALNYGVPSPVDGPGHGYFPAIQTDSSSSQSGLQPLPTFSVHPPSPSMGMANSNGFAPANGQDVSVPEFHRSVNTAPMSPGHAHPLNSPLSPRPNSSYFSQVFGHHVGTPILGMPNNGVLSPMASPLSPGLSPPIDRIRHEYACAYILFFGEIRARLESIHGTSNPEDIKRFAMDSWRSSSPDMQQDYHRRAADLLQEIYKQQDEILRRRKGGQGQGQDPHGNGTPGIGPHEAIEPNGFPTGLSHHSPLLMTLNLSQPPRFANAHAQPQRMNGGHVGDVGMLLSDVILRGGSVQNGGSGWLDNMHPGADMMRHSTQPSVQRRHSHQGDDEDDFEPPSPSDSSGDPTFRGNDDYHSSTRTKASSKRKRASSPARHHGAGGHNGTAPDATVNGTVKRTRTKKRIKDPDAPKHPMSAFLHFLKAVRPAYTKQYRGARIGEISKMISEEWKKLPGEEKDKYNAISERDKQRYAQEMKVHVLKNSKAGATA